MAAEYTPEGPGGGMLHRWVNDGDYQTIRPGANMRLALFDKKLQISANLK